jgi:hypothetical protein
MPIVDNPGLGNCGFYAFGVGLIDVIQKQLREKNTSACLDKLNSYLDEPITQQEILDFDINQYAVNCRNYNRSFLDKLQAILRMISVSGYQNHLLEQHRKDVSEPGTKVVGTVIFDKFMQIVQSKLDGTKLSSNFNEMVSSKEVNQLADSASQNLSFKGKKITLAELKILDFSSQHLCITKAAKNIFLADVFDEHNAFKQSSKILKANTEITNSGHWATHQDLAHVASELEVNLNINGQINGVNLKDVSTITLNNNSNVHWNTIVDFVPRLAQSESTQLTKKLSPAAEKVLLAVLSVDESQENKEMLKDFTYLLLQYAEKLDVKPEYKIDIKNIDTAQAIEGQSDEEFAKSLQEAEFRKAGLKP